MRAFFFAIFLTGSLAAAAAPETAHAETYGSCISLVKLNIGSSSLTGMRNNCGQTLQVSFVSSAGSGYVEIEPGKSANTGLPLVHLDWAACAVGQDPETLSGGSWTGGRYVCK